MSDETYHELERAAKELLGFMRFVRDASGQITGAWCVGRYYALSEFPPELDALRAAWDALCIKAQKRR